MSNLYAAVQALPAFEAGADTVRLLHVADLHLNPTGFDLIASIADQFAVDLGGLGLTQVTIVRSVVAPPDAPE